MTSASGQDLAYRAVEGLFLQIFEDQNACREIGLIAVSRLLSPSVEPQGGIGWYLWIAGRPGAYLLRFVAAEDDEDATPHRRVRADFLLKYYPDPSEPVFLDFLFEERYARVGPAFDHTGTPHFRAQGEIDESWFAIGGLRLDADARYAAMTVTLAAQDRARARRRDDGGLPEGAPIARAAAAGEIDRAVPAWDLAYDLFDRLMLGWAYAHRAAPIDLAFETGPATILETAAGRPVAAAVDGGPVLRLLALDLPLAFGRHNPPREAASPPAGLPAGRANPHWWSARSWRFPPSDFVCERCIGADDALDGRFIGLIESPRLGDFHV